MTCDHTFLLQLTKIGNDAWFKEEQRVDKSFPQNFDLEY